MGNMSLSVFLYVIMFSIQFSSTCCHGKITKNRFGCVPEERAALLKFRQSFSSDPSYGLSSWNHSDCCVWEGVKCDDITGHVIMLDLRDKLIAGKTLDSSLLQLKYLSYLDLSLNDFQLSPIPAFLGSIKNMQYLYLYDANFSGVVPHSLGNLSNLRALNLDIGVHQLKVDDLAWASNLTLLQRLDLSFVNLDQTKDLIKVLSMLPALTYLNLMQTGISNTNMNFQSSVNFSPLSSIQYLNLGWNSLHGEFPRFLLNMTSLKSLDLSRNEFNGHIPSSLGELSTLITLDLSENYLLSGFIPASIGNLTALTELDVSYNNLSGPIPPSLGNLRALRVLNMENNRLTGDIPVSLGQLSNLVQIDLSSNPINGTLSKAHLANLSKLESFSAENCSMLKFIVGFEYWVPPFQLRFLSLRSVKLEDHQSLNWLQSQKNLTFLDLRACGIRGILPKWLGDFNFTHLFLSQNHIVGPIPKLASTLTQLDLSDNMLNGSMPPSLCEVKDLNFLDFSKNQLSGSLLDCWSKLQSLTVLRLSSNNLSGVIPNSIGEASSLNWLHLNNNSLIGQIPSTFKNLTDLYILDVGDNKLSGNLPQWIGWNLFNLNILRLRNNNFYGEMSRAFCQLPYLRIMDIADNKLAGKIPYCLHNSSRVVSTDWWGDSEQSESLTQVIKGLELEYKVSVLKLMFSLDLSKNNLIGEIPWELTNFSSLVNLNLSHNHLEGKIPSKIGDLKSLESLDLSDNHLSGTIPRSLSKLSSLSYLNLSQNNLSGQIPEGNQLQTLDDPSIYDGNPGLCGPPLQNKCLDKTSSKSQDNEDQGENEESIYFYAVVMCGFGAGFWGFIGVLVFKRRWRETFFHYIEVVFSKYLGL